MTGPACHGRFPRPSPRIEGKGDAEHAARAFHGSAVSGSPASGRRVWRWAGLLLTSLGLAVAGLSGCGPRRDPAPVAQPLAPAPPGFYRIRSGDTLSEIAVVQGVALTALADWNGLAPPYRIEVGRLLRTAPPTAAAPQPPGPRQQSAHKGNAPKTGVSPPAAPPRGRPAAAARPDLPQAATSSIDWQWPLAGPVVQRFEASDRTRQGIRIAAHPGQLVAAAAAGTVAFSGGGLKGYGNLIIIRHDDHYLSAYGFNRRRLVAKGDKVRRGQGIAEAGQATLGTAQLHFEIRKDGIAVDPLQYLPRPR